MRSYDLAELEELSGLSRRTISDYVSRGLLAGPSHRGRGARYSQTDLDALRVIPRLRTVLKSEFPNLQTVREFLADLSNSELHQLVRLSDEHLFEVEVSRIRIQGRLKTFFPTVPPEKLSAALRDLTPEQVCGIDRGQIQIGSLIDVEELTTNAHEPRRRTVAPVAGNGNSEWEQFGNSTVQLRIDKNALRDASAGDGIPEAIRNFAEEIEGILKRTKLESRSATEKK
jgi:DNA-binding transcriptional MerR regulator